MPLLALNKLSKTRLCALPLLPRADANAVQSIAA